MTIEELRAIKITDVEQGKKLAADILEEQLSLHRQMIGLTDNMKWQALSNRHFYLRRERRRILHETGLLAIKLKQASTN
jgi:hypothetical protein